MVRGQTTEERAANLDERIKAVKAYSQAATNLLSDYPEMNTAQKYRLIEAQACVMEVFKQLMVEKHGIHPVEVERIKREVEAGPPAGVSEQHWKNEKRKDIDALLKYPGGTPPDRIATLEGLLNNEFSLYSKPSAPLPPKPPLLTDVQRREQQEALKNSAADRREEGGDNLNRENDAGFSNQ